MPPHGPRNLRVVASLDERRADLGYGGIRAQQINRGNFDGPDRPSA